MDSRPKKPAEKKFRVTFAIPGGLRDRLDNMVEKTHTFSSCVIRAAIEKYLTEQGY